MIGIDIPAIETLATDIPEIREIEILKVEIPMETTTAVTETGNCFVQEVQAKTKG